MSVPRSYFETDLRLFVPKMVLDVPFALHVASTNVFRIVTGAGVVKSGFFVIAFPVLPVAFQTLVWPHLS